MSACLIITVINYILEGATLEKGLRIVCNLLWYSEYHQVQHKQICRRNAMFTYICVYIRVCVCVHTDIYTHMYKNKNPLCQMSIQWIVLMYLKFAFLNKNNIGKNMKFITECTTCDILMSFCGGAANSATFMHKGLLIPFTRINGMFIVCKQEFKSAQLWFWRHDRIFIPCSLGNIFLK